MIRNCAFLLGLALSTVTSALADGPVSYIAYVGFPELRTRVLSDTVRVNEDSDHIEATLPLYDAQGRELRAAVRAARTDLYTEAAKMRLTVLKIEVVPNDDEIVDVRKEAPYDVSYKRSALVRAIIKPETPLAP